jgi:hypothetical protein
MSNSSPLPPTAVSNASPQPAPYSHEGAGVPDKGIATGRSAVVPTAASGESLAGFVYSTESQQLEDGSEAEGHGEKRPGPSPSSYVSDMQLRVYLL